MHVTNRYILQAEVKSDCLEKNPVGDVYIFHNTSSLDITTNKYFSEFGNYLVQLTIPSITNIVIPILWPIYKSYLIFYLILQCNT